MMPEQPPPEILSLMSDSPHPILSRPELLALYQAAGREAEAQARMEHRKLALTAWLITAIWAAVLAGMAWHAVA